MARAAISADAVTHRYGDFTAVDGVSLRVEPGEVVGLIGPNGAGKTSLIRVILGLLAPVAGTVVLAGGAPSRDTRRSVGYVPQGLGLWADLTLTEHQRLVAATYGVAVDRELGPGLDAVRDVPVGRLPLGLRRRASFAVALAHDPSVLILDEPTSGVDPLARSRLWDTIHATADAGAAVLVSTHYLDEAARCDRIVLMARGAVVATGPVDQLTAGRSAVRVEAGDRWSEAWNRLEDAGLLVLPSGRQLRVPAASVDDVEAALAGLDVDVSEQLATLEEVFLTVTAS